MQCPECKGEVWIVHDGDESAPSRRKLKCGLCDDEGMAHIDDVIDYYQYMSPDKQKMKRWEAYKQLHPTDKTSDDESESKS